MFGVRGNEPEVIRRPGRRALGTLSLGVVDGFLLVGLLSTHRAADFVVGVALLSVAIYVTAGMWRSGVAVTREGLTVRNTLRTRHVPWSRIVFISPASDDPAFRAVGIATVGGERVRCHALGAMRWEGASHPRIQKLYERLNDHLEAARADGRTPAEI